MLSAFRTLFRLLLLIFTGSACFAQSTVTPAFTIPDTICVNNSLNINNTTVGAQTYFWNFCVADLKQPPTGTNLGNIGGNLNMPVFMVYAQYNNNWYGFSVNFGNGTLVRYDFGNNLLNTPATINLGNFGGIIPNAEGIQIIFNENKWYAIMTGGILPMSTPKMIKIEFGADLTNPAPTVTDWGNFGGLDPNSDLHMFQDGANWYGITLNRHGQLLRFDFTNSFNNIPTAVNLGSISATAFPTGLYVINDNGSWRLFVIDSGDDLRHNPTSSSSIVRFDFGNSLLNTPVKVNLGNPGGVMKHPRDITIIRTCNQTVGFVVNANTADPSISRMDFDNGLGQPPTGTDLGNVGNLDFAHSISKLFRVNESLYGFVCNVNNNTITRLQFAGCNNASLLSSTAHTPPPVKYNAPGVYNINLTIDDGLPTQASICRQVVVEPAPVQAVTVHSICPNTTIRLSTANRNAKYLWNTGATAGFIDVSTPGKYWVDIDKFGCTTTDTFKVEAFNSIDFNFTQNICNPYEVEFAALGSNAGNPRWNFGDGNTAAGQATVNHLYNAFGVYTVTLTAFNGTCDEVITKVIRIDATNEDLIITPDTTICHGTSARLRTEPAIDLCWSPATGLDDPRSPHPVASPLTDITYYLNAKVTGANLIVNGDFSTGNTGFSSGYNYTNNGIPEATYWVGVNPRTWHPGFVACGDHTTGAGNMMVVNGSSSINTVVWEQTITVTPHTNYAFSTWITSVLATNPAQLQFSINGLNLSGMISAPSATCNWTQFYATWNSGNSTTATIAIVNQNLQTAGNDFALDDISFGEVLIKRSSIRISVEKPVVTASQDATICKGSSIQLTATGADTYSWAPAGSLNDAGIQSPLAKPAAITEYTVTGKTARGCIAQDKVLIDLHPDINIIKPADTTVCRFSRFPLKVGGGVGYTWWPAANVSNVNSDEPNVQVGLEKMTFKVTVTDIHHCEKEDSISVDILPYPVFAASATNRYICLGTTVTLKASGGDQYLWTPATSLDDPASATPVASPSVNTIYSVHIQDNTCGFDSTIDFNVTVNPLPVIQATKSNDINCNQPTAVLNASGGVSYTWLPATGLNDPAKASPVLAIAASTRYTVIGKNQYGCESSAYIDVAVSQTGIPRFVVPNAFSPNGDGRNDCFGIQRWGDAKVEEFAVYNRWGQKLFSTKNPASCWDGRFNGHIQPAGGYVYVIRARTICGPVSSRGMLMLVH